MCDGRTWVAAEECATDERCGRKTGACTQVTCDAPGPIACSAEGLSVCDPDLVASWFEACPFGCDELTVACAKPKASERLTDRTASAYANRRPWPDPIVPVCFADRAPSTLELRDAVRLAVDSTWGRFSGLSFSGFEECAGLAPAIEVGFVEECRNELARVSGIGYRGSGEPFRIELCISHFDSEGGRHPEVGEPIDVPLVAFMAKHTFGHALGMEHERYERDDPRVMAEVLDVQTYARISFEPLLVTRMQLAYGTKPEGSLLGASGRCIADSAGELMFATCDGAPTSLFRPAASSLLNVGTGACLQANGSSVTLEVCEGDLSREAFELARMRWLASESLGFGGRCVTTRQPPVSEASPLEVRACDPDWNTAGLFRFEFLGADQLRIRTAEGWCVASPATWSTASAPELVSCGGPRDVFHYFSGQLSIDARCLTVLDGVVEFRACAGGREQHFSLSGPVELGGEALSLTGASRPVLALQSLSFPPEASQILDWFF
jgi:hypothetical protein